MQVSVGERRAAHKVQSADAVDAEQQDAQLSGKRSVADVGAVGSDVGSGVESAVVEGGVLESAGRRLDDPLHPIANLVGIRDRVNVLVDGFAASGSSFTGVVAVGLLDGAADHGGLRLVVGQRRLSLEALASFHPARRKSVRLVGRSFGAVAVTSLSLSLSVLPTHTIDVSTLLSLVGFSGCFSAL